MSYKCISIEDTKSLLKKEDVTIIDIRDYNSFSNGHVENARHIEEINIDKFLLEKNKNDSILIYCYHGISSKSAAQFFTQNGFQNVFSMEEGYTGWTKV